MSWMALKGIILSVINQMRKTNIILPLKALKIKAFIDKENRLVIAKGRGRCGRNG